MSASLALLITCEHGGNDVPPEYQSLFAPWRALLASHSGFDAGALATAGVLADSCDAPLFAATTTRLLVDLNRSIGHPHLFSKVTKPLPKADKQRIVSRYYLPHREAVATAVATALQAGKRVVHIASHSFTPVFRGVRRHCDVGWLYDPSRNLEKAFCLEWMRGMAADDDRLVLRRNVPYRGVADGLTTAFRKRFGENYLGVELEVSQRFVLQEGAAHQAVTQALAATLVTALEGVKLQG